MPHMAQRYEKHGTEASRAEERNDGDWLFSYMPLRTCGRLVLTSWLRSSLNSHRLLMYAKRGASGKTTANIEI